MANVGKVGAITKHKYSFGPADPGGNRLIFLTGTITMTTGGTTTTDVTMVFSVATDIPNVEGVHIQGDGGYVVQYDYTNSKIEIYGAHITTSGSPLNQVTGTVVEGLVFYFTAWGR